MKDEKINFAAIDFECATGKRFSACSVAIVNVRKAQVVDVWESLIKPPNNYYSKMCIDVHGMLPSDTISAKPFNVIYPNIIKRIAGIPVVAHNSVYDRSVFEACRSFYKINDNLKLSEKWYCTYRLYKYQVKEKELKLNKLCDKYNIELDHHNATSDTLACAQLFINYLRNYAK